MDSDGLDSDGANEDGPRRILVACRGASAASVLRWARQAGVETVALTQERDEAGTWAESADYMAPIPDTRPLRWPPPQAVVDAALDGGCDAVHPGWGPLAGDPDAASAMALTGLLWVGPTRAQLELAAARYVMRARAHELGLQVVPASGVIQEPAHIAAWLAHVGRPALVRPLDPEAPRLTLTEASPEEVDLIEACFAHGPVILERLVVSARELEVPFLGRSDGVVALGVRETSVRDSSGRVFVEAPAPGLSAEVLASVLQTTRDLAEDMEWRGLGTARFLLPPDNRPYLLQLKAGLLPWDAATEVLHGLDLVDAQVRLATDDPLLWRESDLAPQGHVLSVVVKAEEGAEISSLSWPEGVRRDSGLGPGDWVDEGEIIGVLTVHAPTRQAAIVRTRVALADVDVRGVSTNLPRLLALFDEHELWQGPVDRDRAAAVLAGIPATQSLDSAVR